MSYFEKQLSEDDPAEWSLRELAVIDFQAQLAKEPKAPQAHSPPAPKVPAESAALQKQPRGSLRAVAARRDRDAAPEEMEGDLGNTIKAFMEYLEAEQQAPDAKVEVKYQTTESFRKNRDPRLVKLPETVALPQKGLVELNLPYRPLSPVATSTILEGDDFGRLEELIGAYKQSRPPQVN